MAALGVDVVKDEAAVRLEQDGALWFYYLDAVEDERSSPPRVYLFGKVRSGSGYASCCVVLGRLERCVHLLLNVNDLEDEEEAAAVAREAEMEFDSLCPQLRKIRAKLKRRNYAFEKPIAQGCVPFLKVVYDAAGPSVPSDLTGKNFTHVFGAKTSLLERVLLTRRIQGPSWLLLQANSFRVADNPEFSFCPYEVIAEPASIVAPKRDGDMQRLSELGMPTGSPPLRLLCISMQTYQRDAQSNHEPVAVALSVHPNISSDATESDRDLHPQYTWSAVRRLDSRPLPKDAEAELARSATKHFVSESSMLDALLEMIQEFDPDVVAGHRAYSFDLDLLASRLSAHKMQGWQRLGRLRRPKERAPTDRRHGAGFWVGSHVTAGRLVCDLALQARDLLPRLGSFDLPHIAEEQLGDKSLTVLEPEALPKCYESAMGLVQLMQLTSQNAACIAKLVHSLQILPLSKQLTVLSGSSWNGSLQCQRAQRNEMLLCHEFHREKFVLPDKEPLATKKRRLQGDQPATSGPANLDNPEGDAEVEQPSAATSTKRGKAAYSGGLVLEPKIGLYDDIVVLLDFNSLYPSIIQEYNLCFTTVDRPDEQAVVSCSDEAEMLKLTSIPDGTVGEGVLPKVIRRLVENRRSVKQLMKSERDAKRLRTLEIRQKALKLTANSMYGCLGFQNSRFYAKPLAALITAKGREALQNTCGVVQQLSLEVVYGDTDSVFVNSRTKDFEEAMRLAEELKRAVNKNYRRLEIDIDGVFGRLLLLRKKKYAAWKILDWKTNRGEEELKGLDIVRRDWCSLAKEMGHDILKEILHGQGKEEVVQWVHNYLTEKGKEMDEGKIPVEKYVILKGLTKAPLDYPDAKNLPHVQVALRMLQRGKHVCAKDDIEYVICNARSSEGGPKPSLAECARHPKELELDESLTIDIGWYKSQQVHALVHRLLIPLEGTDAARVAECLGMDSARFAQQAQRSLEDGEPLPSLHHGVNDIAAMLLDRTVRWKDFETGLPGMRCPESGEMVSWQQLLQPQKDGPVSGIDGLFRSKSGQEIHPTQARNTLTLQLRGLLQEHCEGWIVDGHDFSVRSSKSRRLNSGISSISERRVLEELEYLEHLCRSACKGYTGKDVRMCRAAAEGMWKDCSWALDCNGRNWVDCGQIFGSLGSSKSSKQISRLPNA